MMYVFNYMLKQVPLIILLVTVLATNAVYADNTEEDYEKRLRELQDSIEQLQQQLTKVKGNRNDLQQLLQQSEVDIGNLTKKIDVIKEAIEREKKRLSQLQSEYSQLESLRNYQQEQIIETVNQAHKLGRQSHIKLLLNQQEPSLISRLLRYHRYFIQARSSKINDYIKLIDQLQQLESEIVASTKVLEDQRHVLSERYQQLRSSQANRIQALKQLNADVKSKSQHLSELQLDQKRLQKLLDEAIASLANLKLPSDATLFKKLRGKLPKPSAGKVRHAYGSYRSSSQLVWNGIFYDDVIGKPVKAIHYGRVIFSDYLKGHGLLLIIDHGDGYMSLYAHNQALYKETGDWVSSEEVIATVGDSGGLEHAGLYFEIRYRGQPQNPRQWLLP